VILFHANRRQEDAAFGDEFRAFERKDSNLAYVPTMTAMADSAQPWDGERGHIDAAMLGRHLDGVVNPIYYIAGPPAMVEAMRGTLATSGADTDDIRTEEFSGY
jgi:ferredoxin-NADP reductase